MLLNDKKFQVTLGPLILKADADLFHKDVRGLRHMLCLLRLYYLFKEE